MNGYELADRRGLVLRLLERMNRVDVSPAVLRRAADPFPTPLGTLDAIHLATAVLWREGRSETAVLVTHDGQPRRPPARQVWRLRAPDPESSLIFVRIPVGREQPDRPSVNSQIGRA